ncbi:hypothetical protein PFISCL1PPCAC_8425, partial [Pristionchus fissidentatus]
RSISMRLLCLLFVVATVALAAPHHENDPDCSDWDASCYGWVAQNHSSSCETDTLVKKTCPRSCHICGPQDVEPRFDLANLPKELVSIAFLVGKWRSEFGGKAFFPTIPRFTYGEQLEFSISDQVEGKVPSLNYTAFAWDPNDLVELHSENGYLIVNNRSEETPVVEMNTAMSNGFMTIEEGEIGANQIHFRLLRIGRISFSHDSAVRVMFREWTLLDPYRLEARLMMTTTVTKKLMEHTAVIYKKVYP